MADERDGITDEQRRQRSENRTSQTYHRFLDDLKSVGKVPGDLAEKAAVSVLCALEQRILPDEAKDLEAQLPRKLVALFHDCRTAGGKPMEKFDKAGLIERVAADLGKSNDEAEGLIRAVFTTVRAHISEGEAEDVAANLPRDLEHLWARPA